MFSIGIAKPLPSLNYEWRKFEGSREDAIELAKAFHKIEGRKVIVSRGLHFVGHASKPIFEIR